MTDNVVSFTSTANPSAKPTAKYIISILIDLLKDMDESEFNDGEYDYLHDAISSLQKVIS